MQVHPRFLQLTDAQTGKPLYIECRELGIVEPDAFGSRIHTRFGIRRVAESVETILALDEEANLAWSIYGARSDEIACAALNGRQAHVTLINGEKK